MMTQEAITALKRHIKEIYEEEGFVRIMCDKHVYYMVNDEITSYKFDCYGVCLVGRIPAVYQCKCFFGKVYIPFETITGLTGREV